MENEQLKQEKAIEFATQLMGIGEWKEDWNYPDKYMFQTIKRSFLAGASFVSQPSIEKCNETIEEICKGMENSPELIKHKANWLYILQRLSFFKDMPVLIELIKYEQSLAVSQNRDEEIAIEFGTWIGNQIDYERKTYGRWTSVLEDISTKQLFDLFIESKGGKK